MMGILEALLRAEAKAESCEMTSTLSNRDAIPRSVFEQEYATRSGVALERLGEDMGKPLVCETCFRARLASEGFREFWDLQQQHNDPLTS